MSDGVLVIGGLGRWNDGTRRLSKIATHVRPIAEAADRTTYLTLGPAGDAPGIDVRRVSPSGSRVLDFVRLAVAAVQLSRTGRYDAILTFSLVPYGLFGLLAGALSGRPVHLGIIGMDLDVHATSRYGAFVRWAFRRFDAISVAGSTYRDRLVEMGVSPQRVHTVLHPVEPRYARATPSVAPSHDLLWIGRMSSEKGPERFVRVLSALRNAGIEASAVMVGTGPMREEVERTAAATGVADLVTFAGWASDPIEWYRRTGVTVVTSGREMLPLTVVESMLVGRPVVAPRIGAIPELVDDGRSGVLLDDRRVESYVEAIAPLVRSPEQGRRMGQRAKTIESDVSRSAVAGTWRTIIDAMVAGSHSASGVEKDEDGREEPDHRTDRGGEPHPVAPGAERHLGAGERDDR